MSKTRKNSIVYIDTIADLRNTIGSSGDAVDVIGYYTALDNIGVREYYWDAVSVEADNGGTIIQVTGVVTGRWKMKYSGAVNVKWFGAKGDGVADDTVAIQKAFLLTNLCSYDGVYNISSTISVLSGTIFSCSVNTIFNISDGVTAFKASVDGVRVAGTLMLKDIIFENITFQGSNVVGTNGISLNNVTSSEFKNIKYNGMDCVIVQGVVTGTTFDNISNLNIEDSTTDCNYIVYSNLTERSNDNIYSNCIARAKLGCLYLGGSLSGQHDGANIINNIFFPNTASGLDLVYIYNAIWSTITGNKFFVSARNGIRVEYGFITSVISNNLFSWNGRYTNGGGDAIYISTSAGSQATAYGQSVISDNVVSMPSGNGIYVNSLGSFKIEGNNIVSPNNITTDDTGTVVAYTKDGISINGVSTYFDISNNTVTTGIHGQGGESFATNWRYDIYTSPAVLDGKVNHNGYNVSIPDSIVNSFSMAPVVSGLKLPIANRYQKSPYSVTGITQLTANTATTTVETIADPYENGINAGFQIVFPANVISGIQRGEIATTLGGYLSVAFKAKTTDKDIIRMLVALQPNGGTKKTLGIDVTPKWKEYFFTISNTEASAYSLLQLQNNTNSAGGTVQICGLRVSSTNKFYLPFDKFSGTTAPTVGFYNVGDIVEHTTPVASGFIGWVCTVAGAPGTWKTFGAITA